MTKISKGTLRTSAEQVIEPMPWGRLEWHVSAAIGNSEDMTLGTCVIDVGSANGRHWHPNCVEILRVIRGKITQTLDDEEITMTAGDVITIPIGVVHNAINIGDEPAELAIAFTSAHRKSEGVES